MIESFSPPEILVHGLVTPDNVDKLFKMYVCSRVFNVQILITLGQLLLARERTLRCSRTRAAHAVVDLRSLPLLLYRQCVFFQLWKVAGPCHLP